MIGGQKNQHGWPQLSRWLTQNDWLMSVNFPWVLQPCCGQLQCNTSIGKWWTEYIGRYHETGWCASIISRLNISDGFHSLLTSTLQNSETSISKKVTYNFCDFKRMDTNMFKISLRNTIILASSVSSWYGSWNNNNNNNNCDNLYSAVGLEKSKNKGA